MSGAAVLLALLGPPAVALAAGIFLSSRSLHPLAIISLNGLSPGAGLAAAGRPTIETAICVLMAQASLFIAGSMGSLGYAVPFMAAGAVWGSLYTPFNPATVADKALDIPGRTLVPVPTAADRSAPVSPVISGARNPAKDEDDESSSGYAVEVGCTECGAKVAVPVLHHMAHCSFCGSDHLVVGQEKTLYLTLPERAHDEAALGEALLDHYRYRHYLKLYRASVSLVQTNTEVTASGGLVTRPEADAAAAAAEALVAKKADAFRDKLARQLHTSNTRRFLSPYRHGMGTLYQAGFGRRKEDQEKVLRFKIGTIEASAAASSALTLPEMGKLTYLKALHPAADCAEDDRTLALDLDESVLQRAFGRLDRKQLDRSIQIIRLGSRFQHEVSAVVWRPWWIVDVDGPGIHETLLVDSASGSVIGAAPTFDHDALLTGLPEAARDAGRGLHFIPMECPTCGHEFAFDSDAVLHFCHNCHRVCRVSGRRKEEVEYSRTTDADGTSNLVPFWLFPLRIRTAEGDLVTDLAHLKDGIDGTLDQIGDDAPVRQHGLYVPAVRCINSRLMGEAFNRLFDHTIRSRFGIVHERWPLDHRPAPWSVHLDEPEARTLVPLYLANAFSRRDLARVKVDQIADRLFEAEQETPGRLVYLPVPEVVTNPFARYVGRFRGQALRKATNGPS